ncbi:acetyl-CoA carboxylase biotin carboxylase subunit family protein [Egicoccus sp. AB-alg2]|uniref:ATP-grasp domain-containing protein n=1 Tax=Egicoccus sp. AB-alg2 TaxID=3242693 RepID=UPI00359E1D0A
MVTAVFVAPYLLEATERFVTGATHLPDVRVGIVTHEPADRLPPHLRERLVAHWRVDDALDPSQLEAAVRGLAGQLGGVDRLVGILEQLQVPLAQVRESLGISGMDVATARNFRDKSRMKQVLREAGVPCARHRLVRSADEATRFVDDVGFPVVVKPPAGAGARDTFRLDGPDALRGWLAVQAPSGDAPALLEEFVVGDEHSFDSVTVDGNVVWRSISHYLPTPLEVLRNPWMQWAVLLPRELDADTYGGIDAAGPAAVRALGHRRGLTHLEWFRRGDGSVAVSEVAARPPGAQLSAAIAYAHDVDLHRAWAGIEILDRFEPPERRWAVGTVYLRGQHPAGSAPPGSRVVAVHGIDALQAELGHLVAEARVPTPGQPAGDGYEGEGWVIVRDHDTGVVVDAVKRILGGLRVELG